MEKIKRGLKQLEKQLKTGKLTKANINNRGYNKYFVYLFEVDIFEKGKIISPLQLKR